MKLKETIETSYQQKEFIKDRLKPLFIFINSLKKSEKNNTNELIRENGVYKNYIGIDYTYKKGKDKHIVLELFWGKYDKLNDEEDYFKLIDNSNNSEKIKITKTFNYEENFDKVLQLFDFKLNSL